MKTNRRMDTGIRYWWRPTSCRGPYCRDVYAFSETEITFNGYFYDDESLPQKRLLYVNSNNERVAIYFVEILEKIEGISVYGDGDGDDICFFPTNHITLRFRVIQKDFDHEEERRIYRVLGRKKPRLNFTIV